MAEKAKDLIKKAEKGQKRLFFKSDPDETAELYKEAALIYSTLGDKEESVKNYIKSAEFMVKSKNYFGAINSLEIAANISLKTELYQYSDLMKQAIKIANETGMYDRQVKLLTNLSEYLEKEGRWKKAIKIQEQILELIDTFGLISRSHPYKVNMAKLLMKEENWENAGKIWEELAWEYIDDKFLRFSVEDWLYQAGLCYLGWDIIATKRFLEKIDSNQAHKYKFLFLVEILEAAVKQDRDLFSQVCYEWDQKLHFESWIIQLLSSVKDKFDSHDDIL